MQLKGRSFSGMNIEDFAIYKYIDHYDINSNVVMTNDLSIFIKNKVDLYIEHYPDGTEGYFIFDI